MWVENSNLSPTSPRASSVEAVQHEAAPGQGTTGAGIRSIFVGKLEEKRHGNLAWNAWEPGKTMSELKRTTWIIAFFLRGQRDFDPKK